MSEKIPVRYRVADMDLGVALGALKKLPKYLIVRPMIGDTFGPGVDVPKFEVVEISHAEAKEVQYITEPAPGTGPKATVPYLLLTLKVIKDH